MSSSTYDVVVYYLMGWLPYLVRLPLVLSLAAASHDGIDADVAVEGCGWQHCRVPGTPLDVEAPLSAGGQLVQNLSRSVCRFTLVISCCYTMLSSYKIDYIFSVLFSLKLWICLEIRYSKNKAKAKVGGVYLCSVWIPAENPVVLPTAQEQLRVRQAPVHG